MKSYFFLLSRNAWIFPTPDCFSESSMNKLVQPFFRQDSKINTNLFSSADDAFVGTRTDSLENLVTREELIMITPDTQEGEKITIILEVAIAPEIELELQSHKQSHNFFNPQPKLNIALEKLSLLSILIYNSGGKMLHKLELNAIKPNEIKPEQNEASSSFIP